MIFLQLKATRRLGERREDDRWQRLVEFFRRLKIGTKVCQHTFEQKKRCAFYLENLPILDRIHSLAARLMAGNRHILRNAENTSVSNCKYDKKN